MAANTCSESGTKCLDIVHSLAEGAHDSHATLWHTKDLPATATLHLDRNSGWLRRPPHMHLLLWSAHHRWMRVTPVHANLLEHMLLTWWHGLQDHWIHTRPTMLLDLIDLNLLLCVHASLHRHHQAVCNKVQLSWNVDKASGNIQSTDEQTGSSDDTIIAGRVLLVETGLHHEPVGTQCQARTAANFQEEARAILRLAQRTAGAEASTANIRLSGDVQKLGPLLVACAANAATTVETRDRRLTGSLKHLCLPVASTCCHQLLLQWHVPFDPLPSAFQETLFFLVLRS